MSMINEHPYCWTFTGKKFLPGDPQPDQIDIIDLANGLGREPRFGNQADTDYTVAQHSVQITRVIFQLLKTRSPEERKKVMIEAMLHDGHEFISGDMPKPIKEVLPNLSAWEKNCNKAIFKKFGLDFNDMDPLVKHIDGRIVIDEALQLFKFTPPWALDYAHNRVGITITPWSKDMASIVWLRVMSRLIGNEITQEQAIQQLRLGGRYK